MAPLSIRNADRTPGGQQSGLSMLRVPLGTETDDAIERLRSIREHTSSTHDISQAVGAKELTDITKHAPAATLAMSARLMSDFATGLGRRAPLASCTVSNVPGPAIPLYLNGALMTYFSAIMPISDGMGLVFAVTSYAGKIIISPTSCREQIPDPEFFALCIRESFQEYLELADRAQSLRGKQSQAKAPRAAKTPKVARAAAKRGKVAKSRRKSRVPRSVA
jgi:hypothetical protein